MLSFKVATFYNDVKLKSQMNSLFACLNVLQNCKKQPDSGLINIKMGQNNTLDFICFGSAFDLSRVQILCIFGIWPQM